MRWLGTKRDKKPNPLHLTYEKKLMKLELALQMIANSHCAKGQVKSFPKASQRGQQLSSPPAALTASQHTRGERRPELKTIGQLYLFLLKQNLLNST